MPIRYSCAFLLFAVACEHSTSSEHQLQSGKYIGLESMGDIDITPDDSTDRWYHENRMTIKGDSFNLECVPVVFYKNQGKAYSSSDGGFFFYKGKLNSVDNHLIAKMLLISHDYVSFPYIVSDSIAAQYPSTISFDEKIERGIYRVDSTNFKKQFVVTVKPKGFIMNGVRYLAER